MFNTRGRLTMTGRRLCYQRPWYPYPSVRSECLPSFAFLLLCPQGIATRKFGCPLKMLFNTGTAPTPLLSCIVIRRRSFQPTSRPHLYLQPRLGTGFSFGWEALFRTALHSDAAFIRYPTVQHTHPSSNPPRLFVYLLRRSGHRICCTAHSTQYRSIALPLP